MINFERHINFEEGEGKVVFSNNKLFSPCCVFVPMIAFLNRVLISASCTTMYIKINEGKEKLFKLHHQYDFNCSRFQQQGVINTSNN